VARSWATLLIAVAAGLAFAWPRLAGWMIYERADLLAGQVWRLWTGHLVHYNPGHLFWDLAVFLPAGIWLERIVPGLARRFYVFAPPAISLALFLCEPALGRYAGLSGIAAGLLVLLALVQLRRDSRAPAWFWPAVMLLVAVKILVESVSAEPLFARFDPGVRAVPLAHVGGIVCAVIAFLAARRRPGHRPA
jgi:rhomboid family GlyGly-CTERM serine protease